MTGARYDRLEPGSGCFVLMPGKPDLKITRSMCVTAIEQDLISPLAEEGLIKSCFFVIGKFSYGELLNVKCPLKAGIRN